MPNFVSIGAASFRSPSDYINNKVLLAGVAERETIPPDYNAVIINSTANVYIKFGDSSVTAVLPSDIADGSGAELNSNGFHLPKNTFTHYSIIAADDCIVTMAYYKGVSV